MTRIANSGNATELAKVSIVGCVLADLDFPSGHLYLSDGFNEVTFQGQIWTPLGQFAGIDMVQEGLDSIARPIKLTLSGVDPSIVGTAQTEAYQNRSVVIYFGLLNPATGVFVANPEVAWEGRMDSMNIAVDMGSGKITLNCEHRLRREPKIARNTDVDQQQLHPGDTFFNFITTIVGFKSQWGDQKMSYGGPVGGQHPYRSPPPHFGGWHP